VPAGLVAERGPPRPPTTVHPHGRQQHHLARRQPRSRRYH
jgi:hypothetical protein